MTGIIPIRLNEDLLQKVSSMKGAIGKSTYCKNIVTAFINGEFCRKSDYEKIKSELNETRNNLKTLQTEIIKGKHEFKAQSNKLINTTSSLESVKLELTKKNELLDKSTKQAQALRAEKRESEAKLKKYEEDIKDLKLSVENKNNMLLNYEAVIRNAAEPINTLIHENKKYKQLDLELQLRKRDEAKQQQQRENIARVAAFIFSKLNIPRKI